RHRHHRLAHLHPQRRRRPLLQRPQHRRRDLLRRDHHLPPADRQRHPRRLLRALDHPARQVRQVVRRIRPRPPPQPPHRRDRRRPELRGVVARLLPHHGPHPLPVGTGFIPHHTRQ